MSFLEDLRNENRRKELQDRQRPAKITLRCNENNDEGLETNRRQLTVYCNMELLDALQQWFHPAAMKARTTSVEGKRSARSDYQM
jgi:hypothetical protein